MHEEREETWFKMNAWHRILFTWLESHCTDTKSRQEDQFFSFSQNTSERACTVREWRSIRTISLLHTQKYYLSGWSNNRHTRRTIRTQCFISFSLLKYMLHWSRGLCVELCVSEAASETREGKNLTFAMRRKKTKVLPDNWFDACLLCKSKSLGHLF